MAEISNITDKYGQTFLNETGDKQAVDSSAGPAAENKTDRVQNDKVSLSDASKDLQNAIQAVESTPDIRQEKVNELKQAVESGRYQVDATKVAEKMIGSIISETV